ncbi:MAG TPA: pantetheine-phosphate adenylyltransferase [Desulfomonilaceae bacterium]|nr:pantetheine-phosphate adenylyltransferase [Desulfomonilaceae bacterium]
MKRKIAIYPGSFDPITNGHVDIIQRGARLFDVLIVAVLVNAEKAPLFTAAERVEMIRALIKDPITNVSVDTFDGLLVDYARRQKVNVIVRGVRAVSDYEFELQMALMNRRLEPSIETVLMMPSEAYSYVSSRIVREVFRFGGSVDGLVHPLVKKRMAEKMGRG